MCIVTPGCPPYQFFFFGSYYYDRSPQLEKDSNTLSGIILRQAPIEDYDLHYRYTAAGHTLYLVKMDIPVEVYYFTEGNHQNEIPKEFERDIEYMLRTIKEYREAVGLPRMLLRVLAYAEILHTYYPVSESAKFSIILKDIFERIGRFRTMTISPDFSNQVHRCYNCGDGISGESEQIMHTVFCCTTYPDGLEANLNLKIFLPRCKRCHSIFPKFEELPDYSIELPTTMVGREDPMIRYYKDYAYYDNDLLYLLHEAGFDQRVTLSDGSKQWAHIPFDKIQHLISDICTRFGYTVSKPLRDDYANIGTKD